jgi:voltage-gated potassium channel
LGKGWSFGDSLYYSTVTVTTVGYGDDVPDNNGSKMFICVFILVGLSMVADALGAFVEFLVNKQDEVLKSLLSKSEEDAKLTVQASGYCA